MRRTLYISVWAVAVAALGGCSQFELVFRQPGPPVRADESAAAPTARLATYSAKQAAPGEPTPPAQQQVKTDKPAEVSEAETPEQSSSAPEPALREETPSNQPPKQQAYTAPGDAYRQLAIGQAVTAALIAMPATLGADREASQGFVLAPEGVVGRTGLTSPTTLTANNVIVSRPGLQENAIRGIGYASPQANIFRPQRNPLTGPNGVYQELVRAGFYKDAAPVRANIKR